MSSEAAFFTASYSREPFGPQKESSMTHVVSLSHPKATPFVLTEPEK